MTETPRHRPVPLLELTRQHQALEDELTAAMQRVLTDGRYILGPEVAAFEQEIAAALGVAQAVGVASGTDAIWLALRALDVGPGGIVLTSPFTFFATASAALNTGATMAFADIDPASYNLDPEAVRAVLEGRCEVAKRQGVHPDAIKAIIPVHLYGQPADLSAFESLSAEFDIPLVEDACQAMGAHYGERSIGSTRHQCCFSFFPSKNLGCLGDGGLITTPSAELAGRLRQLRAHGSPQKYKHELVGTNSRLDALQAAILRVKLPHLPEWIAARRAHANAYDEALEPLAGLDAPARVPKTSHAFHQYTVRVADGQRDALAARLAEAGIGHAIYYPIPLHRQAALAGEGYQAGDYPLAEAAADAVLSLPMFPELTESERRRVVQVLTS